MTDDELRGLFEKQNSELRGYIDANTASLRLYIDGRFDAVGQRFDAADQRFDAVDQRFDAVDQRFDAVDQRFDAVGQRFDAVGQRFNAVDQRFDAVDQRFHTVEGSIGELRRHFDVVAERIEGKVALVAEGLMHLDQKLDRTAADIRQEMRDGFDDTHALIRFTYSELDRRLHALE